MMRFFAFALLHLSPTNVDTALEEARSKYSAVFHQDEALRMSGSVSAEIEGCMVSLRLDGLFWHDRAVVYELCANYLTARIPEICDVEWANPGPGPGSSPDMNGDRAELERLGFESSDTVVINHRPGLTFTGYNIY